MSNTEIAILGVILGIAGVIVVVGGLSFIFWRQDIAHRKKWDEIAAREAHLGMTIEDRDRLVKRVGLDIPPEAWAPHIEMLWTPVLAAIVDRIERLEGKDNNNV